MKNKLYIATLLILVIGTIGHKATAQCCNIFASNGTAVVTSGDKCATLAYPTSVCEELIVSLITLDVWIFYEEAFNDVHFSSDSDALTPASINPMDKIVSAMKNSSYTLRLSGYADSTGAEEYNRDLSARRALAVKKYLVDNGVDPNRVVLAAYGEKMPKATNRTKRGRSINRRVEFDLY